MYEQLFRFEKQEMGIIKKETDPEVVTRGKDESGQTVAGYVLEEQLL